MTKIEDNLIPDVLLKDEYYLNQITLLLKQSQGIPEQIKAFTEILKSENDAIKDFFNLFINDGQSEPFNINEFLDNDSSTFLDYRCNIYGVSKTLKYTKTTTNLAGETTTITKNITLTNKEIIFALWGQIFKNNYDGTTKSMLDFYTKLKTATNGKVNITIYPSVFQNASLTLYGNFSGTNDDVEHLKAMFQAGYFTIIQTGIAYETKADIDLNKSLRFSDGKDVQECNKFGNSGYYFI